MAWISRRQRSVPLTLLALAAALVGGSEARGQAQDSSALESYLETARRQFSDPSRDLAERARIAREAASALDQAAQRTSAAGVRRSHWAEAVALLNDFSAQNPRHPLVHSFELQAAVYLWAQGRTWLEQLDYSPNDDDARREAVANFEAAFDRLQPLFGRLSDEKQRRSAFGENVRYRLAHVLADLAEGKAPENLGDAFNARQHALARLDPPITDPTLQGFAELLRGRLLTELGRFRPALEAIEAAENAKQPPTPAELLDAKVALLLAQDQYEDAVETIEGWKLDEVARDLRIVRVRAAQLKNLFPGAQRNAAEADAFDHAGRLRASGRPETRLALIALARSLPEPSRNSDPDAWDLLAEGYLALGQTRRAIALIQRGAKIAETQGHVESAWTMRFRAGAMYFQVGDFERAAATLAETANDTRIDDTPSAPQRAKASLLRTLALARLADDPEPGADVMSEYTEALRFHLDQFPDDPTANDTRWALGQILRDDGQSSEAVELWSNIPASDRRWLLARREILQVMLEAIDQHRQAGELQEARRRLAMTRDTLNTFRAETEDPHQQVEIDLDRIRVELLPEVGDPNSALTLCDRLLRGAIAVEQREQAKRDRIVALALSGRTADAERAVREEMDRHPASAFTNMARQIDASAESVEDEVARRRLGYLVRALADQALRQADSLTPDLIDEAKLRRIRGLSASGDTNTARVELASWSPNLKTLAPESLEPLANSFSELGFHTRAINAYRLHLQRLPVGTRLWFKARYSLALSYYRANQSANARQLIDGTLALHPELGGADLKERFLRLRKRLEQ